MAENSLMDNRYTMRYADILTSMTEEYWRLTGTNPHDASDIGIRMKVLATALATLWESLAFAAVQSFPASSSGVYLDAHAEMRGLVRKAALPSQGVLVFSRDVATELDLLIPAGTLCAPGGGDAIRVETTTDVTLPAGATQIACPARGSAGGASGNYAPGVVSVMVTPVPGITRVTNPAAFLGGADAESDAQLLGRLQNSYRDISNGTNKAFYLAAAFGFEGVGSANVVPRARGTGTVDVVCAGRGGALQSGLLEEIQAYISTIREIGVDVRVTEAADKICAVTLEAAPYPGGDYAAMEAEVRTATAAFFEATAVGQPLLISHLTRAVMDCGSVYNCRVIAPAADAPVLPHEIIRLGALTLQRMAVIG